MSLFKRLHSKAHDKAVFSRRIEVLTRTLADFIPANADLSAVSTAYSIADQESFATARELLKAEGLLGGSSTGTLLAAALRYCREQKEPKRVVTFVCDTGTRYLSKVYNDAWMIDEGLLAQRRYGDLRDLIARRTEDGGVVSVAPGDTLLFASDGQAVSTAGVLTAHSNHVAGFN